MSKKHWARGVWGVAVVATTSAAFAALPPQTSNDSGQTTGQQPGSIQPSTQPSTAAGAPRGNAMAGHHLDHFMTKVLIQANKDEIETARLAEQRSSNQDVKKFAQEMIDAHTRFMNRLEQTASNRPGQPGTRQENSNNNLSNGTSNRAVTDQGTQGGFGQNNATDSTAQPQIRGQRLRRQMAGTQGSGGMPAAAHQFVRMMDEVAQQTHQTMLRDLGQKEGIQFDRCYLSSQIMNHTWMVNALTVFERNATPDFQPVLQEGLQTAQQHLAHAKSLMTRIEQGQAKTTASR